jgi:Uri superfamily endonuclease
VRPHWHLDYLCRYTRLEAVWYACGVCREHEWEAEIAAMPGAMMVLPGFGSSDCRCATHMYWLARMPARYDGALGVYQ